jgi:hypothetical protein
MRTMWSNVQGSATATGGGLSNAKDIQISWLGQN